MVCASYSQCCGEVAQAINAAFIPRCYGCTSWAILALYLLFHEDISALKSCSKIPGIIRTPKDER